MAPQTIAASAAGSVRRNDTASSANDPAAIATIPAARPSIPSIRLTRFARNAIHRIVIGYDAQPRFTEPITGTLR